MRSSLCFLRAALLLGAMIFPSFQMSWAWDHHDLITQYSLAPMQASLAKWKEISVVSLEKSLPKIFDDPKMTVEKFIATFQLNPKSQFPFGSLKNGKQIATHPVPGEMTSAAAILSHYADEPDWGMDREINLSPDQKYTGGYTGPTSQGFRHLFYRKWRVSEPFVTFHVPPRELGEAPWQAHRWFETALKAFKAKEYYWGFRFLAWSLHYLQDLTQPFHSNQLMTPQFIAWKSLPQGFNPFVVDTTQIIANYHWLFEKYVTLLLKRDGTLRKALQSGKEDMDHLAVLEIALLAARQSSRLGGALGEHSVFFFGKKFQNPAIDVPRNPDQYPPEEYEEKAPENSKKALRDTTEESFELCGLVTRNLISKALENVH